jgi:hypothetical protein
MTEPGSSDRARHSELFAGALLVVLATVVFAALTGDAFRPDPRFVGDFTQDWLSSRDVIEGRPAYGPLAESLRRHFDAEPPEDFLPWNAHPPGSVLLALPLARLEHATAFFVWNAVTFPMFVCAVWIVAAELGPWRGWRAASVAAAVAVVGVTCYPIHQQVVLGQFNALLALLITGAWAADRRGWGTLAGGAVGAAAAVKLFPAFLLLYLIAARRWRAAGVAVVVGGAISACAAVALGTDAYRTYVIDVVPAVSARYATQWNNLSLSAFWLRLFDPTPESRVVAVWAAPTVGKVLATASRFVVVGLVGWAALRATTTEGRDRAFALAVVGMVLVSPIAWPHYLIMLVVPVGLLVVGLGRTPWRWALLACLAVMWLPDTFVPKLILGDKRAELMSVHRHPPLTPGENILIASVPHYALLGLFLLTLWLPTKRAEPPGTS